MLGRVGIPFSPTINFIQNECINQWFLKIFNVDWKKSVF